jgi:hypothetical protein
MAAEAGVSGGRRKPDVPKVQFHLNFQAVRIDVPALTRTRCAYRRPLDFPGGIGLPFSRFLEPLSLVRPVCFSCRRRRTELPAVL